MGTMATKLRGTYGRDPRDWTVEQALLSVADKLAKRREQDLRRVIAKGRRRTRSRIYAQGLANKIIIEMGPSPSLIEARDFYLHCCKIRRERIRELLLTPIGRKRGKARRVS
jgi:hypothetical protein